MKYYSTQRPVMPGSFPKGTIREIKNFDSRIYCEEIGREAWGYIDYSEPIKPEAAKAYELVPAE